MLSIWLIMVCNIGALGIAITMPPWSGVASSMASVKS
jgi:hypothetical protein